MSKVFIVDDNGIIVEELIAYASYRSGKGITVKPATPEQERRIREVSENGKRLLELEKELKALESGDGTQVSEVLRLKRESMAAEIQNKQMFNNAVEKIRQLQEQAAEMQIAVIETNTSEGKETVEAEMDELTGNGLSAISKELDQLDRTFLSDDPEHIRKVLKILADIEKRMNALPEMARLTFLRLNVRMELAEQVRGRTGEAGWRVSVLQEGDVDVPTVLCAENAAGEKAAVIFQLDGQVRIETPGFAAETREALQQLVLNTLRDSGMTHAKGLCTDHAPTAAPDSKQPKRMPSEDTSEGKRKAVQL